MAFNAQYKELGKTVIGKVNLDGSVTTTSFPPDIPKEDQSVKEAIYEAVYRCRNFTSKRCNICELTGKSYGNADPIYTRKLDGANIISPHHCYGDIQYHKENEKYLVDANILFECEMNLIQYHNLQDVKLKFQRSNGDINEGHIKPDTPITFWDYKDCLAIKLFFSENDEIFEKTISFHDYKSSTLDKEIPGLISLNKEFFDSLQLNITVKSGSNMFVHERVNWKARMKELLDKSGLKYSFINE